MGNNIVKTTKLTEDNYALAETQIIFTEYLKRIGSATGTNGLGVFMHNKEPFDPKDHTIVRPNFDTQYSFAILDLTEEAILTMPETHFRYQSAWIITEEHYEALGFYEPGEYLINQEKTGSKYVMVGIRTQVNIQDKFDIKEVNKLQDQLILKQKETGSYISTNNWDKKEVLKMRAKYMKLVEDKDIQAKDMFGKKGEISLENHNCGVAYGWGMLTEDQAVYILYIPNKSNDSASLSLKDVPAKAFWSITVYDKDGFPNENKFHINSSFAKKNSVENDDSVTIHFGGDFDCKTKNFLDTFPNWQFVLRLYQPTENYFNGNWTKPVLVFN